MNEPMNEPSTYTYAAHTLALDHLSGYGLLRCPEPNGDVVDPVSGWQSLHETEREAIISELAVSGWTPTEDEPLRDGDSLVLPLMREDAAEGLDQMIGSFSALADAVGASR